MSTIKFFGIPTKDDDNHLENWCGTFFTNSARQWKDFLDTVNAINPDVLPVRIPINLLKMLCADNFPEKISESLNKGINESLNKGIDAIFGKDTFKQITEEIHGAWASLLSTLAPIPAGSSELSDKDKEIAKAGFVYYADYFGGHFKDRNGASLEFSSETLKNLGERGMDVLRGKSKAALSGTSLNTCSQMAAIMMEFLGDLTFRVPFYSRSLATLPDEMQKTKEDMRNLDDKITGGLDQLPACGDDASQAQWAILTSKSQRRTLLQISKNEEDYLLAQKRLAILDNINKDNSKEKKSFTCFSSGLIWAPIQKIKQYGDTSGKDYAELVGEVVANLAAKSEAEIRTFVGSAIRGAAVGGLNNEAIAEIAAALAGGIAKKTAEASIYKCLNDFITTNFGDNINFTVPWNANPINKKALLELLEKSYVKKA